jgi:hypothetical protein
MRSGAALLALWAALHPAAAPAQDVADCLARCESFACDSDVSNAGVLGMCAANYAQCTNMCLAMVPGAAPSGPPGDPAEIARRLERSLLEATCQVNCVSDCGGALWCYDQCNQTCATDDGLAYFGDTDGRRLQDNMAEFERQQQIDLCTMECWSRCGTAYDCPAQCAEACGN